MGFRALCPVGQQFGDRVDGASMLRCPLLPGGVRDLSGPGGSGFLSHHGRRLGLFHGPVCPSGRRTNHAV